MDWQHTEHRIILPMIVSSGYHTPVLCAEVIDALQVKSGKKYIDATVGGGGHAEKILDAGGIVLGVDQDQDAIAFVESKVNIGKELFLERGNFADIAEIAKRNGFEQVDGILFDLGMSSHQIDRSGRGFSYRKDEPLDMRMDTTKGITAADIINRKSTEELYEIFTHYSEELNSRPIAAAIVRTRTVNGPFTRTSELVRVIESVVSDAKQRQKTPTRIFQALRIAINEELDNLKKALEQAMQLLVPEGVIAVISYHSLEDRIVKLTFRMQEQRRYVLLKSTKPILPSWQERQKNSRSRSARLRVAHRL